MFDFNQYKIRFKNVFYNSDNTKEARYIYLPNGWLKKLYSIRLLMRW